MKKAICCVICFALLLSFNLAGFADVDLSGMSYEELVALKDQINLAIWNSDEWEEVLVPQGVWHVGEDIPVGHWTISAADGVYATVKVGTGLTSAGKLDRTDIAYETIKSPTRSTYKENEDKSSIDLNLPDGAYVSIEDGSVIFTPYQGKPALGFKKAGGTAITESTPPSNSNNEETSVPETDKLVEDLFNALLGSSASSQSSASDKATTGERNALSSAESYLAYSAFSYQGLIHQLEFEGFSTAEATYAADNCGADWMKQALKSAKDYLAYTAFSYNGLVKQLEFEGFTHEEAKYAADNCGADWMEQAYKSAKSYLAYSSFSKPSLIKQLEFEGFTNEQAVYGAEKAYN